MQLNSARVAAHSLAGYLLHGAFTAKVLLVQTRRQPGSALPTAGRAHAIPAAIPWYTSAPWHYNRYQLPQTSSPQTAAHR